jgi:2-keto-3-deoxy-6-phosphogluconate aldolase
MPTGGVDNSNLKEFVENKRILACVNWPLSSRHGVKK